MFFVQSTLFLKIRRSSFDVSEKAHLVMKAEHLVNVPDWIGHNFQRVRYDGKFAHLPQPITLVKQFIVDERIILWQCQNEMIGGEFDAVGKPPRAF